MDPIYNFNVIGYSRDWYQGVIEKMDAEKIVVRLTSPGDYYVPKSGPNKGKKMSTYRVLKRKRIDDMAIIGRE